MGQQSLGHLGKAAQLSPLILNSDTSWGSLRVAGWVVTPGQRRHRGRGSAGHLRQVWGRPPPKRSPEPPACRPGSRHPSSAPPDGPRLRPGWAVGARGRVHTPGCRPLPVCPWASEGAPGLLPGWLSASTRLAPLPLCRRQAALGGAASGRPASRHTPARGGAVVQPAPSGGS